MRKLIDKLTNCRQTETNCGQTGTVLACFKSWGDYIVAIAKEGNKEVEKSADTVIYVPDTMD